MEASQRYQIPTPQGIAYTANFSSNYALNQPKPLLASVFTFFAYARSNYNYYFSDWLPIRWYGGGIIAGIIFSDTIKLQIYSTTNQYVSSGVSDDGLYLVFGGVDRSGNPWIDVNGTTVSASPTFSPLPTGSASSGKQLEYGGATPGSANEGYNWAGLIAAGHWDRFVTPQERAAIRANVWQLLEPRRVRLDYQAAAVIASGVMASIGRSQAAAYGTVIEAAPGRSSVLARASAVGAVAEASAAIAQARAQARAVGTTFEQQAGAGQARAQSRANGASIEPQLAAAQARTQAAAAGRTMEERPGVAQARAQAAGTATSYEAAAGAAAARGQGSGAGTSYEAAAGAAQALAGASATGSVIDLSGIAVPGTAVGGARSQATATGVVLEAGAGTAQARTGAIATPQVFESTKAAGQARASAVAFGVDGSLVTTSDRQQTPFIANQGGMMRR